MFPRATSATAAAAGHRTTHWLLVLLHQREMVGLGGGGTREYDGGAEDSLGEDDENEIDGGGDMGKGGEDSVRDGVGERERKEMTKKRMKDK